MHRLPWPQLAIVAVAMTIACTPAERTSNVSTAEQAAAASVTSTVPREVDRQAYFGDLHVHTRLSFDAHLFGAQATPEDAYRFAKGEPIQHPAGFSIQLATPLDFQAGTDHSEFLGMMAAMHDPSEVISQTPFARQMQAAKTLQQRAAAFRGMRDTLVGEGWRNFIDLDVVRSAWQEVIAAAEKHNAPGRFTTFIGYEYTSAPESQNLHRNVIFRGAEATELPFTRLDSSNPEDLWAWMDRQRDAGIETIAIPHNSNGSNGQMFRMATFAGGPLTPAYADLRMRNEPLAEITQIKGTSDTHPMLSPNDEWADFEIMPYRVATNIPSDVPGSYVREAYLHGIALAAKEAGNPFRFGVVGSSDTHVAAGSFDESHYWSKAGLLDATAAQRGSVPLESPRPDGSRYSAGNFHYWSTAGLAGVWAEENTRDAIFAAFKRKEVFATSGPRMRVRFFAGYALDATLANDPAMVREAYAGGVPMGSDLVGQRDATPSFLVWGARDPASAPLQRVQVIKGFVADGKPAERVYDVACSDGGVPNAATHRCPDNGARVNLADCSISTDAGAAELRAVWRDPAFAPDAHAVYYVRVLENPTCRWSTWDALRAGVPVREELAPTIQERAWSSPIWYVP